MAKMVGHHKVTDPSLNGYRNEAVKIAKDLCYSKNTILELLEAESKAEVDRIMTTARMNMR